MKETKFYTNPVVARDFPDPFVFKFRAEYYAVATGFWHDGGVFGILHSRDLINWTDCGSALNPVPFPNSPCYWAPEIYYQNGKFYLYYSVGNEENMRVRAAVSASPAGGYVDAGIDLTDAQFAIDAHVFVDDADNSKWLFYATDFLDYDKIGTGTVRDKMLSPFELAGKPQPVTRAKYDWQIYDPNRASKGNVRWHTIEGSTVLKRKGLYYQMFSGGNWQNVSYGVSYATARNINQTGEWSQIADGEITFPILRTIPEKVIGPGHNSVVRGTDNRQLYCVYHRWAADLSGRQMALDPLDFAGERMLIVGASFEPVFVPNAPMVADFFDDEKVFQENWTVDDLQNWTLTENSVVSNAAENAQIVCNRKSNSFLIEVSHKTLQSNGKSAVGFCLKNGAETILRTLILPSARQITISEADENLSSVHDLPADFEVSAFHLWRVEVDHEFVKIRLNEADFIWQKQLETAPTSFALETHNCQAAFSGFALTEGFENLFDWRDDEAEPRNFAARGWTIENDNPERQIWKIADNLLQCAVDLGAARILKINKFTDFELVVNARLNDKTVPNGCYGFFLRTADSEILLTIENDNAEQFLNVSTLSARQRFVLPADFAVGSFAQFRFRANGSSLILQLENVKLGEIEVDETEKQFGILVRDANASFDMVRITAIS